MKAINFTYPFKSSQAERTWFTQQHWCRGLRSDSGVTTLKRRDFETRRNFNGDKANEFLARAWTGDPAALTRDTGWSAVHDLGRGMSATAAWYREAGWV